MQLFRPLYIFTFKDVFFKLTRLIHFAGKEELAAMTTEKRIETFGNLPMTANLFGISHQRTVVNMTERGGMKTGES